MKKYSNLILTFALLLLLLVSPVMPAKADVLIEPFDDFYEKHEEQCVYLCRSFYVNSEDGTLSVKLQPGAEREIAVFNNGEVLYIQYTYNYNGAAWGVAEFQLPDTEGWTSGWMPMDQLLLVYDGISFREEHYDEFYNYKGEFDTSGDIVLWTWPGSGDVNFVLDTDQWRSDDFDDLTFSIAYKDIEGREWGFIGYYYGSRDVWVCIDDPSNQDIPAFNAAPEPVLRRQGDTNADIGNQQTINSNNSASGNVSTNSSQTGSSNMRIAMSTLVLIIVLVVVVVTGTAVLILVFWRRKR